MFEPRAVALPTHGREDELQQHERDPAAAVRRQPSFPRPQSATPSVARSASLVPCRSLLRCPPRSARAPLSATATPEPAWPDQQLRALGGLGAKEQPLAPPQRERPTTSPALGGSGCPRCRENAHRVRQLQRELAACQQARLAAEHRTHAQAQQVDETAAWQHDLLRGLASLGVELPPQERPDCAPPTAQVVEAVRRMLAGSQAARPEHSSPRAHIRPAAQEQQFPQQPGQAASVEEAAPAATKKVRIAPLATVEYEQQQQQRQRQRQPQPQPPAPAPAPPAAASTFGPESAAAATAAANAQATPPRVRKPAGGSSSGGVKSAGLAVARFQLGPMLAKMVSATAAESLLKGATAAR